MRVSEKMRIGRLRRTWEAEEKEEKKENEGNVQKDRGYGRTREWR